MLTFLGVDLWVGWGSANTGWWYFCTTGFSFFEAGENYTALNLVQVAVFNFFKVIKDVDILVGNVFRKRVMSLRLDEIFVCFGFFEVGDKFIELLELLLLEAILLFVFVLDNFNRVWVIVASRVVGHLEIPILVEPRSGSKDSFSISFQIPFKVVVLGNEKTDRTCGLVVCQVECGLGAVQDEFLWTWGSLSVGHFFRLTVVRGSFIFWRDT